MDGFEQFEGNPFESILSNMGGGQSQSPMMQQAPQQGGMMGQNEMTPEGIEMEDNQLMKGKNPDNSQYLVGAVKALQQYITNSTDSTEIATARSIIALVSRLIEKDQSSMAEKLGQDQQMMQAAQPPQSA